MNYGKWTVIEETGLRWLCRCECGTERRVVRSDLWSGRSTNCGCVRRVTAPAAARAASMTHGMDGTPIYRTWIDMRRRCHDPRRPDFQKYGARGIVVCEQWRESFETFYRDMGARPEGMTIDRIDNNGNYSPENCRWAARTTQERNKSTNRLVILGGVTMTIAEACERSGITKSAALARLARGWSDERTFSAPLRVARRQPL